MKKFGCVMIAALGLLVAVQARAVLFDFDNAPLHTSLPMDLEAGGITAHFSATGQGFSIQRADQMGFTPVGFSGSCISPNSVYPADLLVGFSVTLTDFSIMYAPQELGCDDSATMRVTAYLDNTYVGTNTTTAPYPGTWPTGTLTFTSAQGFNRVVVHYDSRPPTCQDYGPIFMADNMNVTAVTTSLTDDQINPAGLAPILAPNPFRGGTTVLFRLARVGPVSVTIHDAQGRRVRTLSAEAILDPGVHGVRWDGRDDHGYPVTAGIYLCRVQAGAQVAAARVILLTSR